MYAVSRSRTVCLPRFSVVKAFQPLPLVLVSTRRCGLRYLASKRRCQAPVPLASTATTTVIDPPSSTPVSFSRDSSPVADRQEGILLSNVPSEFCSSKAVISAFRALEIKIDPASVLIINNLCGVPTGKVLVLTEARLNAAQCWVFPPNTIATLLDYYDVANWVERVERYHTLSNDLRWLAAPDHFNRTITLSGIPETYGRREVRDVLRRYAHVTVDPTDIVFQFDGTGDQADVAWVVCPSEQDANRVLENIQELAVPQRVQYASLFGCAFLSSRRNSFFVSSPQLDFELHRCPSQVLVLGWDSLTSVEDMRLLLRGRRLVPSRISRIVDPSNMTTAMFLLECNSMKEARDMMKELERMRQRWDVPKHQATYAFPRMADVRWQDENGNYADANECDSDVDDPIDY